MSLNPSDIAHDAVARKISGETVTPATITATLVERGCTPAKAQTLTKMATALIPTVTQKSLNAWTRKQVA